MAFSRSVTARSKSRSPAPPVGFQSQPRANFYPPSHYAAAAGLPYARHEDPREASSSTTASPALESPRYSSLASHQIPSEASSFGSNTAASPNNHLSILQRRQSQLGNIPALEAQLVPSLRDTINRMTSNPRRTSGIEPKLSPRSPEPDPPSRGARANVRIDHSSSSDMAPARKPAHLTPVVMPSTSRTISTPKPDTDRTLQATPVAQSTSAHQQKLKSVLKSYLRPPTPKLSSQQSPRSMVVDIKKGAGMASYLKVSSPSVEQSTPVPASSQGSTKLEPSERKGRSRSRTDPGVAPIIAPTAIVNPSVTPTIHSGSRLPRPGDFPQQRAQTQKHLGSHQIDSPSGKKGQLLASEPTSYIQSDSRTHSQDGQPSKLPRPREQQPQTRRYPQEEESFSRTRNRFGLGFGFQDFGEDRRVSTDSGSLPRSDSGMSDYEETDTASSDEYLVNAPLPSESSISIAWENEVDAEPSETFSRRTSYDIEEPLDVHRTRRETLLGMVQDLDTSSKARTSRISFASEASDYGDQRSLVISDSGHFYDHSRPVDHFVDSQECRTSHTIKQPSSSPLPTFKVSSEDDYYAQSRPDTSQRKRQYPESEQQWNSQSAYNPREVSRDALDHQINKRDSRPHPASPSRSPRMRKNNSPSYHAEYSGHQRPNSPSNLPSETGFNKRPLERELRTPKAFQIEADVSSVAESQHAAATRQRRAFGIPRPISDYYTDSIHESSSEERLPHANSDLSSVGDDSWREDCGISADAERLFTEVSKTRGQPLYAERVRGPAKDRDRDRDIELAQLDRGQANSSLSRRPNRTSIYDEAVLTPSASASQDARESYKAPPEDEHLWRSTLSLNTYRSLAARYGETEMQRQQIIWEFCRSEEAFVRRLHCAIDLFVQPLRIHDSKKWISGVPPQVAHLFDWLEDIVNLHVQVLGALNSVRSSDQLVIERMATMWKTFVPRLEIYQPYLVRLEETAALIEQLMMDDSSDFGEFVNIQEGSALCQGWSLERFLIEPVNRLAQYPEFFRRLQSMTPRSHPDYLPTMSVLHSTKMVIRVMSEVKFREDEYDVVKELASRIHGLPIQVIKRERKLLCQGTLRRIPMPDNPQGFDLVAPLEIIPPRNSKLISAINDWGMRRHASGSSKSTNSTAMSFPKFRWIEDG
ncbi:hypothetical protein HWV62_12522 [Athelia sp. TMB]|nr:hypothetical protein HWV62_12522 [Athelia sp. TMB]